MGTRFVTGEVVFAAITDPVRCCVTSMPLYAVFLAGQDWCVSAAQPRLYDAARRPLPPQPIPAGSTVTVAMDGRDFMRTVQIVSLAEDCPFAVAG